ncbi:MAG: hypothetical protein Q9162_006518 [Coniocarpon cinnabarinum]
MNHELKLSAVHRSLYTGRPNLPHAKPHTSSSLHHTRSLTVYSNSSNSSTSSADSDMATETISPSSPPELSSSWSSNRSSSIRSSSHRCDNETDLSNFEDISLSDPRRMAPKNPIDRPNKPRSLLRTTTAPIAGQFPKKAPPSPTNLVPMKNELRSGVSVNTNLRNLSNPRSPIRMASFSGAPSPSLAVPPRQSRRKNDAPKPPRPHGPPHRSVTSPVVRPNSNMGPFLPMRRTPTHTGAGRRRSAKELEAEFDKLNDLDEEEVPEDAIITNIPISPCRPVSRSHSVSPERGLPSPQSPITMDLGRAQSWDFALSGLNAEIRDLTMKLEDHKGSSRRNSAEIFAPSPTSSSPPRPTLHHAKSTTFAMPPVQRSDPLIDPLPVSKEKEKHLTRTRPSWLPPKSKTEEKKHLKEYKRMMDAFAESEKRKSADGVKTVARRSSRERAMDENLRAWRSILGDWHTAVNNSKTRDRWWAGVPPALRGQVWARAIGNDLHLTVASFKAALGRAKAMSDRIASATPPPPTRTPHMRTASLSETKGDVRARRSLAAMEKDIETGAFPRLGLFQKGQARHENLRDLLMAYASYREDTGHVRGTAGIAALLLLQHMPAPASSSDCDSPELSKRDSGSSTREEREREVIEAATAGAFIALANLLNRPLSLAFCINDSSSKDRTIRHVEKAIKTKSPRLHEHLSALMSRRVTPDPASPPSREYSVGEAQPILRDVVNPLAQSLMTSVLTAAEAARFFDVLAFEGDGVIVRAIVGILGRCEGSLYGSQEEIHKVLGWQSAGAPAGRGEDDWIKWVRWAGREEAPVPR